MGHEPVLSQVGDFAQRAGLLEQMACARYHIESVHTFQLLLSRAIHFENDGIVATDY
jgi:hypothetical protein